MLIKSKHKKSSDIQDNPMKKSNGKQLVQKIFDHADVQIDGKRSWDIQVGNPNFYGRF